ncbi:UBX domain protein 4 [Phyllostomus discolor]|uniref:UBX domain protein 4 n=1 Tax=Phyllostomus discolor TaxID=89673 RepID=A0A834ASL7_9CHIR|nr:UBX domain protein 4 [Phyllostomus discolor]
MAVSQKVQSLLHPTHLNLTTLLKILCPEMESFVRRHPLLIQSRILQQEEKDQIMPCHLRSPVTVQIRDLRRTSLVEWKD